MKLRKIINVININTLTFLQRFTKTKTHPKGSLTSPAKHSTLQHSILSISIFIFIFFLTPTSLSLSLSVHRYSISLTPSLFLPKC